MPPTTLGDIRQQRGLDSRQMAKALGCSMSVVTARIDQGDIAPNHPLVHKIATAFGLSAPEVAALCRRKAMTPGQVKLSTFRMGKTKDEITRTTKATARDARKPPTLKKKPGETWGAWRQRQRDARKALTAEAKSPGTALVHVPKKPAVEKASSSMKRAYNALRLMDPKTRQCARSLAMATTLAAIKGQAYLDVAVPTEGMAEILNDWLRLKGIPEVVVLAVDYDKVFG